MAKNPAQRSPDPVLPVLLAIAALTAWRVAMLWADRTELSTDEAQYWLWSRHLSWGEYSKPPLIGWLIAGATSLLGDRVEAVRLPAALIHAGVALVLFALGRRIGDGRLAGIAALSYLTMPAVTLGSALMTTDTPMLLFLALALLAQHSLARQESIWVAVALGLAVGAGILSKHAMLYGVAGMALAAAVAPAWRICWRDLLIAAVVALVVVSPHLWWLAESRFVTVQHMAESGSAKGVGINPAGAITFLVEQFAVMGPLLFLAFWLGLLRPDHEPGRPVRGLAAAGLTVLAIVTAQALFSRALANWAVGFTLPGCLVAAWWMRDRRGFAAASLLIGLAVALALPLAARFGTAITLPDGRLALSRYLGHDAFAADIRAAALRNNAGAVISGDRDILAALSWGLRDGLLPVNAAPHAGAPRHHWDLKAPLSPGLTGPILLVTRNAPPPDCAQPVSTAPAGRGFLDGSTISLSLVDQDCARP